VENVKNTISEPLDLRCFFGGRMPLDPSANLLWHCSFSSNPTSFLPFLHLKKDSAIPVNSYPAASAAVAF